MNTFRNILILSAASTLMACGSADQPDMLGADDPQTETFRQALPSAEDVEMSYSATATPNGLAGQYALLAGLTANAVIGTNAHIIHHFAVMRFVANMPPTEAAENFRAWQADNDGLTVRVEATRAATPRGFRYDYSVSGKPVGSADDFLPVIDGHVVRLADEYEPRDGFGIVRVHYDNLNTLEPEREIDGKVRVAFRKADRAHQVHVRAIGVESPDDPDFPKAAEWMYAVSQEGAGGLRWYSNGDVNDDGTAENVAVHTLWRADKSGIGSALVFGGSLEVDYWHLVECWGSNFVKAYDMLEAPELRTESGEAGSCFDVPTNLEPPAFEENIADEDPAIPAPMDENG